MGSLTKELIAQGLVIPKQQGSKLSGRIFIIPAAGEFYSFAVQEIEYMKDDAKKAMERGAPHKAPLILIGAEWYKLSNEQKALALVLIALGIRDDSA